MELMSAVAVEKQHCGTLDASCRHKLDWTPLFGTLLFDATFTNAARIIIEGTE